MRKKEYRQPRVAAQTEIILEHDFMKASIVDNISKVETTGQKVENYDFGADNTQSFNFTWEE